MKKCLLACVLAATSLAVLVSCGGEKKSSAAPKVVFSLNHSASTNHPYQRGAEFLKAELEKISDGNLSLDIYPANQIASGSKAVAAVKTGTLDFAVENPMSVVNSIPDFDVLNLPFLFDDDVQAFKLVDGKLGVELEKAAEERGFKIIGYWYNGYRCMSNSKHPITKPEDVKGLKFRIAESKVFSTFFEVLGGFPVALPNSEIFTALQTGTVDGQENPQNNYINNKYYEANRFYSTTRHVFSVEPIVMSMARWDSLSSQQQEWLVQAVKASEGFQRADGKKTESEQLQKAIDDPNKDIEVYYIQDYAPWRKAVSGLYDKYGAQFRKYLDIVEADRK